MGGRAQSLDLQGQAGPCHFCLPASWCLLSLTLQMRAQKHKVKMLCRLQVSRTSAPTASTSLWAVPCPRLGHLSGLSLQGGAIRTREGEAAGIIPTPRLGQAVISWSRTPGPSSRLGVPPAPWEQDGRAGLGHLHVHRARSGGSGT